jgi:GntR family phosphonate transport system transcriptional regulator
MTLASRFNVNRHTVRQALQFLQARGLVSVEQGRGTFVRARTYDYRLGRRVRFRNSFSGDTSEMISKLIFMSEEPLGTKEAQRLGAAEGAPAWTFRLLRIVDDLPLSTSFHRLPTARFPGFDRAFEANGRALSQTFRDYGVADYIRLSTRIQAVHPTEEEQGVLSIGPTQPILLTRGIDGLPDGTPFHETVTAFVGERIELLFEPE